VFENCTRLFLKFEGKKAGTSPLELAALISEGEGLTRKKSMALLAEASLVVACCKAPVSISKLNAELHLESFSVLSTLPVD